MDADQVRAYAQMNQIPLEEAALEPLAASLTATMVTVADLWTVDVDGEEPCVILPVDRL